MNDEIWKSNFAKRERKVGSKTMLLVQAAEFRASAVAAYKGVIVPVRRIFAGATGRVGGTVGTL